MKSSTNVASWNGNDLFSRQNTTDVHVSRGQLFNGVQSVRGKHPTTSLQSAFNSLTPSENIFRNNNQNTTNTLHNKPPQKHHGSQEPTIPGLSSPTSLNNLENHTQETYKKGQTVSMHLQTHHGSSKSLDQQALKNNFGGNKNPFNIKNSYKPSPELVSQQNQPQQALLLQEKQQKYQQSGQIISPAVVAGTIRQGKQFSSYSSAAQDVEQLVSPEILRNECNIKKQQHASQHSNSVAAMNVDRMLLNAKNMNINLISSQNVGQKQGPVIVGQHARNHSDCENMQKNKNPIGQSQLNQQNQLILQGVDAFKSNYQYEQSVQKNQDTQKTKTNIPKGSNNPQAVFQLPFGTKTNQITNQRAKSESTELASYFLKTNQSISGKVVNTCDDAENEDSVVQKAKKQMNMRASTPKMTYGGEDTKYQRIDATIMIKDINKQQKEIELIKKHSQGQAISLGQGELILKDEKKNQQINDHCNDSKCLDLESITRDMSVDFSNVEEISLMIDDNEKGLGATTAKNITQSCSKDQQQLRWLNQQIEELKKENDILRQQLQLSCEGNALRETELRSNFQQCLNEKMNGIIKIEELQSHLVSLSEQLRKERQKVSDAMMITCQIENQKTISNFDKAVLEEIKKELSLEGVRSDEILPRIRQLLDKDAQKLVDCLTEMIVNFTPYNKQIESKPSIKSIWKWIKQVLNEYIALKSTKEDSHHMDGQQEKFIVMNVVQILNVKNISEVIPRVTQIVADNQACNRIVKCVMQYFNMGSQQKYQTIAEMELFVRDKLMPI